MGATFGLISIRNIDNPLITRKLNVYLGNYRFFPA